MDKFDAQAKATKVITDLQLSRLNHIRERAGADPLTLEEANGWLKHWSDTDWRNLLDRIGSE